MCGTAQNDDKILPLDKSAKIAFIGEFADKPRYQGGGSSHINSFKVTSALEAVKGMDNITYAQGFVTDRDETVDELLNEAVELAKNSDVAVIFAGLPESFESEGFDRKHMRMPDCQLKLIDEVAKVNENVIIVLHNGSAVEMPFADKVKGILEMYLGGQNIGTAEKALLLAKLTLAESLRKLSLKSFHIIRLILISREIWTMLTMPREFSWATDIMMKRA